MLLSDLKQLLLYCARHDVSGVAAQRNATFEKGCFPEFATGYYFYATVLLSNFKIYIIFILPLLSIYFYFIAYRVGDIWVLNVWRIGPGCCFFILPFVSACSDVLIFTKGMRQGHISIRTHTHTLITLPFYLTLRVCGYIYKSRQI